MGKSKIVNLLFITILVGVSACTSDQIVVSKLKLETRINPIGIDVSSPRFSWQISSKESGILQTAYQIIVAESLEKLYAESELNWNSGKVNGDISVLIPYAGEKLKSGTDYYWKVKVWTTKGRTAWSETGSWTMAYLDSSLWKAKWIGMDSTLNSGKLTTRTRLSARYLRKVFTVDKEVKSAVLSISGLGMYECYINGQKISNDVFAPTATDYTKHVNYNVFDVSTFIVDKQNTMGVILGNGRFFSMRMENIPGGKKLTVPAIQHYGFPKLLMQLDIEYMNGEKKAVISDGSWKISTLGPIVANNEFDGEEYDANLEFPGWNQIGFDDKSWRNAQVVEAPKGKLVAQLNPNIKTMRILRPDGITQIGKDKFVVDIGQNMVGWLAVNLNGYKNKPVILRYAETLQKDGNIYTANLRGSRTADIYTPAKDGKFFYEPRFAYHGFRYVEITGTDSLPKIADLVGKVNYDEMAFSGTFETSDSTLNQIYRNACWGLMGNYRSMPTDCPQRDERMGWLGDRATGCFGESFIFDNQLLYAKWAQDIHDAQKPGGSVPDVVPAYWVLYNDNITWPGTYIHVANMLYEQFGDERPIKLHYESMKLWVKYMQEKYMKDEIMTKDQYGDWCMPPENLSIIFSKDSTRITDGNIISTSFYYRILNIMAKYALITGTKKDEQDFLALAERVKTAYNNKFFQKEKAQYGNNTVTANMISLMQGLVPSGYEQKVFENLSGRIEGEFKSHVSVGLIGIQFLMRGLTAYNRPDLAYRIASNRTYPSWGYMVENGATTIWELWNGNTADPAMNSGNHLMLLGDLLAWYYENLAGIQTDKIAVGFKKIIMKPIFPKGLNYVKASHESPYGTIISEWRKDGKDLKWKVIIPANSSAVLHLPTGSFSAITANGKEINDQENIKLISSQTGETIIQILSGEYLFNILNVNI
jgi:alpha-L-rhamnosidase